MLDWLCARAVPIHPEAWGGKWGGGAGGEAATALHTIMYEEQRAAGVTSALHTFRFWSRTRMGLLVRMRGEEQLDFARLQSGSTEDRAAENAPVSSREPCRLAGCIAHSEMHCWQDALHAARGQKPTGALEGGVQVP